MITREPAHHPPRPPSGTPSNLPAARFGTLLADFREPLRAAMGTSGIVARTTHWDPLQSNSLWLSGLMNVAAAAIEQSDVEAANLALRDLREAAEGTGFRLMERGVRARDGGFAPTTQTQLDAARAAWRSLVRLLRS